MPFTNSLSEIVPSDHQSTLFLIHDGISCELPVTDCVVSGICMSSSLIKNCIPPTNALSSIFFCTHQLALFQCLENL